MLCKYAFNISGRPSHLPVSMLANLGVNWAFQDFAGACRSLRLQHYANAWLREIAVLTFYGNAHYLRDHYGC